ncbi:hypothetical protein BJV82DRAFT_326039 [Fennellomyces sp. T-0311]|nr:hypothetical protein BJV82DRAFT_326039 [Fennellomyces sp. T-0311]
MHSHATHLLADGSTFDRSAIHFKLDGRLLHLTCNCIPISIEQRSYTYSSESRRFDEIGGTTLFTHTSPYNRSSFVFIKAIDYTTRRYGGISTIVDLKTTHHLLIAKEDNTWTNTTLNPTNITRITLSLTDKGYTKCFILSELGFRSCGSSMINPVKVMPVVKQDNDGFYCCIGTYIEEDISFIRNSLYTKLEKKQTFIIK